VKIENMRIKDFVKLRHLANSKTVTEYAKACNKLWSVTIRQVQALEKNGYVKRFVSKDRREREIEITEKGRKLIEMSNSLYKELVKLKEIEG